MDPLAGLVLCGGDSSRMGEDKCFLRYHRHPQWEHLVRLLEPLCSSVMVSCQVRQLSRLSEALPSLPHPPLLAADLPELAGHGPMSGLLTAAHRLPGHSFLLVGCDYPLLTAEVLQRLIGARRKENDAVCFSRGAEAVDEPLVTIYEATALPAIRESFRNGEYSLRKTLQQLRTVRLEIPSGDPLLSVDTPEEFHQAMARMKSAS
ncbi:MAG: molybdenum cofactor guanylyltransferase [Cyclobacteriaceae bacterium]|nr:molybdenum cofactor guanylyltransferase [Cyclobacteriaceae bacterium]